MRKIIHRLRQKSEEEKRHLLHIFTFIGAVILIILWIFTLRQDVVTRETRENIQEDFEPFTELSNDLVDINSEKTEN